MFYKYYDELTWEEVEKLDKEKCCVLLPLSSIEQHGKHLPVGTDDYILRMCMEQLEEKDNPSDITFLCLPILGIGTSVEHMTFPGTISFSATTYFAIINDIVTALAKHGFKKMVTVNGHGGNTSLLAGFSQEMNLKHHVVVYNLEIPAIYNNCNCVESLKDIYVPVDIHAGDMETSMMLYKEKELVHMEKAVNVDVEFEPYFSGWLTRDFSETGTLGRPLLATEEKGKLLLDYITDTMAKILVKIGKK